VKPFPVALAATLHDPNATLLRDVLHGLPKLQDLYAGVAVSASPPTSPRIVAALRDAGVFAGSPPTNTRGPLYRLAIRAALRAPAASVHYLDFDRALHWLRVAPREYRAVVRVSQRHAALIVGRTERAHESHHRPLWATELVANRLMADRLGVRGRLDLLTPSFVVSRQAARELLRRSRARDAQVYGEWAAIVPRLAGTVAYIECRGLDWETPDRHRRAIRRAGLAAWRRRQETPREWAARTIMASVIVDAFERTCRRVPGEVGIVRLRPRTVR
jgi:hypothetical protein